jgi:hypothetical protein
MATSDPGYAGTGGISDPLQRSSQQDGAAETARPPRYQGLEVTIMATSKVKVQYPFRSKAQILSQVASDDAFLLTCLGVLYARQTAHEQDTKSTLNRNRQGFMSSHAVRGSELAVKAASGEELDGEQTAKARDIVSHYGKQLAAHFRAEAIEASPDLAEVAKIFSAG